MKKYIFSILTLMLLIGCRTPEMKIDDAIYRARECAVDQIRDIDESQISHIKFAIPEYQSTPLFKKERKGEKSNMYSEAFSTRPSGFDRTNKRSISNRQYLGTFMWFLPESNEVIVVTGVGLADLSDWNPLRAVKRPLLPANPYKYTALNHVREKAMARVEPYESDETLNNAIRNKVRFEPPEVYFLNGTKPDEGTSYFIWQLPNIQNAVVVRGIGTDDFSTFKVQSVSYEDPVVYRYFTKQDNFGEMKSLDPKDYIK